MGFSDAVGQTNATLIRSTCDEAGTLLQPSRAMTAVDATVRTDGGAPRGHVLGSYDGGPGPGEAWAHYVLGHQLEAAWRVTPADFWPRLSPAAENWVYRTRHMEPCSNLTAAARCVRPVRRPTNGSSTLFFLPKRPTDGNLTFTATLATLWPVCPSGWVVLGQLSKIAAASHRRFPEIRCTAAGVRAELRGAPHEVVPVTTLAPQPAVGPASIAVIVDVALDAEGRGALELP